MPPSLLPIAPKLSRSFKYQEYLRNNSDPNRPSRQSICLAEEDTKNQNKRNPSEAGPSERCFEVRPSTNGVGMFATKEISTGDIIIDSEEPILSTSLSLFPAKTFGGAEDPSSNRNVEKANDRNGAPTDATRQDEDNDVAQHEEACYERCMLKPPFCQTCGTPIGNLRQDHLRAPLHLELPGIQKGDVGLVFTLDNCANGEVSKSNEFKIAEQNGNTPSMMQRSLYSHHAAWCSEACFEKGRDLHEWLYWNQKVSQSQDSKKRLKTSDEMNRNADPMSNNPRDTSSECSRRLQMFLEKRDNPKIFEMAVHAILLVLSLTLQESPGSRRSRSSDNVAQHTKSPLSTHYNYFWWEDYGSHPLWWTIGAESNQKDRFQSAKEFADILRDWSQERILLMKGKEKEGFHENGMERRSGQRKRCRPQVKISIGSTEATITDENGSADRSDLYSLFSVDNIGALLGMLQCNVMEFSYPSPLEQYMEQAEEFMDEEHLASIGSSAGLQDESTNDCDESDGTDQVANSRHSEFLRGCRWLRGKYWSAPKEDPRSYSAALNRHEANSGDSIHHSFFDSPEPVVGSGLYPLLTLANHHCNPNASIEFLRESNLGSMIALRPIKTGEEICITYVPNAGSGEGQAEDGHDGEEEEATINAAVETSVGYGHSGSYFKHFEPTRTWNWLNSKQVDGGESDGDGCESSGSLSHDNVKSEEIEQSSKHWDEQGSDQSTTEDEKFDGQAGPDELEDGAHPKQRALALLEYGFMCTCTRCDHE